MAPPYEMFATLARDPLGEPIISVIAKRTYEILPGGKVRYADQQLPLVQKEEYETRDDRPCDVPLAELDTWPIKMATDIVVTGKVHTPDHRPVTQMNAGVQVGEFGKAIQVYGDRRPERNAGGSLIFTEPEPFESLDLTYWRAYGGIDSSLVRQEPEDLMAILKSLTPEDRPGAYPRNSSGVGYIVQETTELLERLRLPNFEDPANLLTPDRLIVRDPALWWTMPLPQGLGWFNSNWYPRCSLAGLVPGFPPPDDTDKVEEVRRGFIPKGRCYFLKNAPVDKWMDMRFTNGASPGLAVPYLKGNEPVRLVGLLPEGETSFMLPGEQPEIPIRFEKKKLKVKTFLHTLLIEPEEMRFSLVWSGRADTPRVLPDKAPTNEDPMYDMLAGFDITVDGIELEHEPEPYKPQSMF